MVFYYYFFQGLAGISGKCDGCGDQELDRGGRRGRRRTQEKKTQIPTLNY